MTSNLTVAALTGGTVFHIHGFDDGVAAEFTFHIQLFLHQIPDRNGTEAGIIAFDDGVYALEIPVSAVSSLRCDSA